MAESVERLLVRIDATTEVLRRELKRADQAVGRSDKKINKTLGNINKHFQKLNRQFSLFGSAITALGFKRLISGTISAADSYASLQGQLKLVTNSQEELNTVYNRALSLANETRQSTESTVKLYARLARSTEQLNLSQDQLFTITKAVNQSFIVSGASASEASSAILQLSQGLAAGALRGEELNSVLENSPRLARAIAEGLGVTIGQLREMGKEGELTAEAVTRALLKTAGTINDEFKDVPVTIGGIFQQISNDINDSLGKVDTSSLNDALNELRETISSEQFRESIGYIGEGLLLIASAGAGAAISLSSFGKSIGENLAIALNGIAADDLPRLEAKLSDLREELAFYEANGHSASLATEGLRKKIAQLEKQVETANKIQDIYNESAENTADKQKEAAKEAGETADAVEELAESYKMSAKELKAFNKENERLNKLADKLVSQHNKANEAISDGVGEIDEMVRSTEEYIEELEFELSLVDKTAREQAILTAVREQGGRATGEMAERIRELTGQLYDAEEATRRATEAQKPFQDALQQTAARIDAAFANAWKGAIDSFDAFASGIKDAFKQLLGELAHIAITKPILLNVAGALGLGGASSSALAATPGGGGGILSSILGATSSVGSPIARLFGGLAGKPGILGQLGFKVSGGLTATGGLFGGGAALGGGITAGAGLLGGLLGNQLFGPTTGIGGALGAVGGGVGGAALGTALGGPIGAVLGGVLGSGLESALGFGKNNGNQGGLAVLDLATGGITSSGIGKSFDQANVNKAAQIANELNAFVQAIGGATGNLEVRVGNKFGVKLGDQKFGQDTEGFLTAAFEQILDASTNLEPYLKSLIEQFDGTAKEMAAFATELMTLDQSIRVGLLGLDQMLQTDPISRAANDFEAAQRSLTEAYDDQIRLVEDLTREFDGSLESLTALNSAFATSQQMAYQLAMAIEAVRLSTESAVSAQIDYFNQQTRTNDEQIVWLEGEITRLFNSLPNLLDPAAIEQTSQRILELQKQLFDLGSPELQREYLGSYVGFAEEVGRVTQEALNRAGDNLAETQMNLNQQIQSMLQSSAQEFQDASTTMFNAANVFSNAVNTFLQAGFLTTSNTSEVAG